jgi:hypothetical protein
LPALPLPARRDDRDAAPDGCKLVTDRAGPFLLKMAFLSDWNEPSHVNPIKMLAELPAADRYQKALALLTDTSHKGRCYSGILKAINTQMQTNFSPVLRLMILLTRPRS